MFFLLFLFYCCCWHYMEAFISYLSMICAIFLFSFIQGVSQPYSPPYLPEPALAVHAATSLTTSADHDYVTSMLAAWGQLIMDDIITTANGNKVLLQILQ